MWLHDHKQVEGGVVWSASPRHGLVVTDFLGLGGLVVAACLWGSWLLAWMRRR